MKKKPVFYNRPNTLHKINGKDVWQSRSCCVNIVVLAIQRGETYVLVEKRSQNMPDGPGLHSIPSGYIDYNEKAWDTVRRELYEETGLLLDEFQRYIVFDNNFEPFYVISEPDDSHQNIVLCYCIIMDFENEELPDLSNYDKYEVESLNWVPIDQITTYPTKGKYKWGFNHNQIIKLANERCY